MKYTRVGECPKQNYSGARENTYNDTYKILLPMFPNEF